MTEVILANIIMNAGTQVRTAINSFVVEIYAKRMVAGNRFPPITVFDDHGTLYLADGFHRCLAAQRCGWTTFPAEVQPGSLRDAFWYALGANRIKGQPLDRGDKTRAAWLALEMFPTTSNRDIARQMGCAPSIVTRAININREKESGKNTGAQSARFLHGRTLKTKLKRDKIREMLLAGHRSNEIATTLNAHHGAVAAVRRELGLTKVDYTRQGAQERRALLHKMAADGHSSRQIAADLGLVEESVRGILRRDGVPVPADVVTAGLRHLDANRIMSRIAADADDLSAGANLIEFSKLDPTQFADWLTSLRHARSTLGMFIRRIQELSHGQDIRSNPIQVSPGAHSSDADPDSSGDATGVP